ncbi:hypothetical protein GQH18_004545 [Salmonella enterica]|nr:hypothetical protein [Salmonella enterica]EDV5179475.1 hypothetical protein [Salmonella enterica subsp. enterica serovar Javiana]EDT9594659.1 hypothetical protein [Salmonella enterica]EDY5945484.1 hypothetical protein [Salmonella enterica]EDY6530298.1 hypothetical protein [Salmonella enterica]
MKTENMCTIRRQLWQQEDQERADVLALWEADYQDNKPKKADVNHTHKQGEADHHAFGV